MDKSLPEKINRVLSKIRAAEKKRGRKPGSVQLVAVTKQVSVDKIREAMACGLSLFGENRVEEAAEKIRLIPDADWHMIGHLQSRKAKAALPLFRLIHSVDSVKLIQILSEQAEKLGCDARILLEVNVSGEKSKYGFSEQELWETIPTLQNFPRLKVEGLMTLAPLADAPEKSRLFFRQLSGIFEKIRKAKWDFLEMRTLSMGMSQDYEVAIEEGATLVRIGRALFGEEKGRR